ncbi:alpha/beta hydrolase [Acrocarpospora phusangensis]|nr:alpha/beta hydrolase [Acrocarpospora phusangensis]
MTLLTVTLAVVGSLGLSGPAAADSAIEERPCPVPVPDGTTCGFLLAPERRDVFGSATVKVAYAVHRGDGELPDPVVFTSGGPGSASAPLLSTLVDLAPGRDVVVIEQRGGRYSEPRLECPEIASGIVAGLKGSRAEEVTVAAATCRARLTADLRGYRTREIAADVVDLRRSLGYAQWNLFGVSYSTRAMLLAATMDPEGTRSVVLDSFLPESTPWYDQAVPSLRASIAKLGVADRFDAMIARLNRVPAVLDVRDPVTRAKVEVHLRGDDVATMIGEALQVSDVVPIVPALVDGVAGGDYTLLEPLADQAADALTSHEWGQYYAVQCQDEAPSNTFEDRRLITVAADAAVCGQWRLSSSTPEQATTAAPVLVLGGQYDPTTPPEAARTAVQALPNARFAEFAGIGHGVFLGSLCARQTVTAFLADPQAAAPCDAAAPPHRNVRPGELHLTTLGYTALGAPWVLAPLGLFLLTAVLQLLGGTLTVRRGGGYTALAGLSGLAFGGLAALSLSGMAGGVAALAIGVPTAVVWYSGLAVASAALSIVAAFRLRAPAISIVPAAVGIVFVAWLYGWAL